MERKGKPCISNDKDTSHSSVKLSHSGGIGAEISKIISRISKLGELGSKGSKSNSDQRKHIQLRQLLLIPGRRHSTTTFSNPRKRGLDASSNGFSNHVDGDSNNHDNDSNNKAPARPRSFSVAIDSTPSISSASIELYHRESHFQRKGDSIRKGFGGVYKGCELPIHVEDDLSAEEEEEEEEEEELFQVPTKDRESPENCFDDSSTSTLTDVFICNDTSERSLVSGDFCHNLSFFSCPNFNERIDILRRKNESESCHVNENFDDERKVAEEETEQDTEGSEQEVKSEMKKVKVELTSDEAKTNQYKGASHLPLYVKDDPRRTVLDHFKRHSLSQAPCRITGSCERSSCFLSAHGSRDDVTSGGDREAPSFRSSMPAVASHVVRDFGSNDRVLPGCTDREDHSSRRHQHHHYHQHQHQSQHQKVFTNRTSPDRANKKVVQDHTSGARPSSSISPSRRHSDMENSTPNQLLEKSFRLDPDADNLRIGVTSSDLKNSSDDTKEFVRADVRNYIRFRDMKDARRKFFESDSSIRDGHHGSGHNPKNPFLGLRPKSSATLSNLVPSSRSPSRAAERHSADASTSGRHRLLLSQLSYEPKLLQEENVERKTTFPSGEKFDKRFSSSTTTVNGGDGREASASFAKVCDGAPRIDEWRSSRPMDQCPQKKIPVVRHHRKRESLDSGFDMRMEDSTTSYPASEDSLTSISSPDSQYRNSLFSPPQTKTSFSATAPINPWFQSSSPKLVCNLRETCNGGGLYSSLSVSTTSFSYQTTKRTFSTLPRGVALQSISIFRLAEESSCHLVQSLKAMSEKLRSVEMELIGYAAAIIKTHEGKASTDKQVKTIPPALLSSYVPKFLGNPLLLSCFHVKEFFPEFFLEAFPWQPMKCYNFDGCLLGGCNENNSHNKTLTEDNIDVYNDDNDEEEEEEEKEQLDYPEIRKKLDELTRRQIDNLKNLQEFLEGCLKTSKDKRNQISTRIQTRLTDKELERCQNFSNESDKILKLFILLSQRVSKYHEETLKSENIALSSSQSTDISSHRKCPFGDPEKNDASHLQGRKKHCPKLTELEARLADALHLKDSIEKRGNVVHEILSLRDVDKSDIRDFFQFIGESFVLSLILLWTLERLKMATEFLQGLEKLAEDEHNLMKQRERKKKRKNKVIESISTSRGGIDDDEDGDEEGGEDDDDDDEDRDRL